MNKGFTLIELLVVVLIIGILAAIALPQYIKAVERSRISEAAQRLGDMATIAQVHFMQTGNYPTTRDEYTDGTTDVVLGQLDTPSFVIDTAAGPSSFGGIQLTANRTGGDYRGTLTLYVGEKGGIVAKTCTSTGAHGDEFCKMAETFGYIVPAVTPH